MSKAEKAEQRALEAYPVKEEWVGNQYGSYGDVNERFRGIYQKGYHQAEKDLELGWEDILSILKIHVEVYEDETLGHQNKHEVCQEVLKRFKERKEK